MAGAKGSSAWLGGIDELVDRGDAGAFVASRMAYRRLIRRSGWLVVPALVGLALFWSFFELTGRRMNGSAVSRVIRLLGAGLTLELAVVAVVLVFTVTQLHDALGGVAWWGSQPRGNDDARGEAVTLASAGGVGLVTAYTRRPELTDLGGGSFYANCGSGGRGGRAGAGARRPSAGVRGAAAMFVGRARGGRRVARAPLARCTRSPDLHVDGASRRARAAPPRVAAGGRRAPSGNGHVAVRGRRDRGPASDTADRRDGDRVRRRDQPGVGGDAAARQSARRAPPVRPDRGSRSGRGAGRARRRRTPVPRARRSPRPAPRLVAGARPAARERGRPRREGSRHRGGHAHAAGRDVPRDAPVRLRGARQSDARRAARSIAGLPVCRSRLRPVSWAWSCTGPRLPIGHAFGCRLAAAVR